MNIQVLKEVEPANAFDHSQLEADNNYYATLDDYFARMRGIDSEFAGNVVEVYRDINQPYDDPFYYNVSDDRKIDVMNIATLRQLVTLEISSLK